MSFRRGPNIVKQGLVLHLDAANQRSFRGEPTENLAPNPTFTVDGSPSVDGYDKFGFGDDNTIESTTIPSHLGIGYVARVKKNTSGWGTIVDGSSNIESLTNGTKVTVSFYVKGVGGTIGNTIQIQVYANSDGGSISTGTQYTLTDEWKRYSHTFTWNKTVNSYSTFNGYARGEFGDTGTEFLVSNVQFEIKPYPTPFVNGTRGTTFETGGGWADLSANSNHGELVNGVQYDSSNKGSLVFDGIDDYIKKDWPSEFNIDDNITPRTWETWVKPNSTSQQAIFGFKSSTGCSNYCNGGLYIYNNKYAFNWYDLSVYQWLESSTPVTTDNFVHIVSTFDGSSIKLYINGKLENTYTSQTNLNFNSGMNLLEIGYNSKNGIQDAFNGNISIIKFCKSKALTSQEVLQNYNAVKDRFGL